MTPIWYKDVCVLYDPPEQLAKFFPVRDMSLAEQLNAVLRFSIYFAILLLAIGKGPNVLLIPVVVAFGTYMTMDTCSKQDDFVGTSPSDKKKKKPEECVRPTKDNPFMNVLNHEYVHKPDRGPACNIFDVSQDAESLFASSLPRDADDIFNTKSSSRQFVTNPVTTIPNDQATFATWLYGKPPEIKANNSRQ
jgi:hypothetical protein